MKSDQDPVIVVATILNDNGPTGVQAHFREFRHYLQEHGRPSTLVTPYSSPRIFVYPVFAIRKLIDRISGAASIWWYRYWHAFFLKRALRNQLSKMSNYIVYAQCPLSARAAIEARGDSQQRVVMAVHFNCSQADEWCEKGKIGREGWMARSIRAFESETLPSLDGIVYVSHFMKGQLQARIPSLQAVPSDVIPNFCRGPSGNGANLEPADVISVGTLEPRKNQQFLLEVIAYAASQAKRYTLVLIGDGPERNRLERLAGDLGIQDQVRFLGNRQRAIELMPSAKLYAHSATMENLPLAIIEAMACGLPVLAPAVGGIPDLFEQGKEGFYWMLDDVKAAGDLLIRMLDSGPELQRMADAARSRFDSHFAAARVASRLYAFLMRNGFRAISG